MPDSGCTLAITKTFLNRVWHVYWGVFDEGRVAVLLLADPRKVARSVCLPVFTRDKHVDKQRFQEHRNINTGIHVSIPIWYLPVDS